MKHECKYNFGQLGLIMFNEFDDKHGFVGHKIVHGKIDAVTFTEGDNQPEYRLVYEDGHEWQNEKSVQPIASSKESDNGR